MSENQIGVKPPSRRALHQAKRDMLIRFTLALVESQVVWTGTANGLLWLFVRVAKPEEVHLLPQTAHGLALSMRALYEDLWLAGIDCNFHWRKHPYTRAAVWRIGKAGSRFPRGQALSDLLLSKDEGAG